MPNTSFLISSYQSFSFSSTFGAYAAVSFLGYWLYYSTFASPCSTFSTGLSSSYLIASQLWGAGASRDSLGLLLIAIDNYIISNRHLMIRKYDYLLEKEEEQPYNFVPQMTEFTEESENSALPQDYRKKSKTMHATITEDEPLNRIRYRQIKQRQQRHNKSVGLRIGRQEGQNFIRRDNFIYNRTMDNFKQQLCSIKLKQGLQQIVLHSKIPKLVSNLSSYKKISSFSQKQVTAMQIRLKNRLKLVQKLKNSSKAKQPLQTLQGNSLKQTTRQTLDRRINDINKIVNQDAGSINLKIQQMDPINQMHRIRMIVKKGGHRQWKLVSNQQHDNIEQNIYEVRQLMRKYLKEKPDNNSDWV